MSGWEAILSEIETRLADPDVKQAKNVMPLFDALDVLTDELRSDEPLPNDSSTGSRLVELIIKFLKFPMWNFPHTAAFAAQHLFTNAAAQGVSSLLHQPTLAAALLVNVAHDKREVRDGTSQALAALAPHDPNWVTEALTTLKKSLNPSVKWTELEGACMSTGRVLAAAKAADAEVVKPLIDLLIAASKDTSRGQYSVYVRRQALHAMGRLVTGATWAAGGESFPKLYPVLAEAAKDRDIDVRKAAAKAAGATLTAGIFGGDESQGAVVAQAFNDTVVGPLQAHVADMNSVQWQTIHGTCLMAQALARAAASHLAAADAEKVANLLASLACHPKLVDDASSAAAAALAALTTLIMTQESDDSALINGSLFKTTLQPAVAAALSSEQPQILDAGCTALQTLPPAASLPLIGTVYAATFHASTPIQVTAGRTLSRIPGSPDQWATAIVATLVPERTSAESMESRECAFKALAALGNLRSPPPPDSFTSAATATPLLAAIGGGVVTDRDAQGGDEVVSAALNALAAYLGLAAVPGSFSDLRPSNNPGFASFLRDQLVPPILSNTTDDDDTIAMASLAVVTSLATCWADVWADVPGGMPGALAPPALVACSSSQDSIVRAAIPALAASAGPLPSSIISQPQLYPALSSALNFGTSRAMALLASTGALTTAPAASAGLEWAVQTALSLLEAARAKSSDARDAPLSAACVWISSLPPLPEAAQPPLLTGLFTHLAMALKSDGDDISAALEGLSLDDPVKNMPTAIPTEPLAVTRALALVRTIASVQTPATATSMHQWGAKLDASSPSAGAVRAVIAELFPGKAAAQGLAHASAALLAAENPETDQAVRLASLRAAAVGNQSSSVGTTAVLLGVIASAKAAEDWSSAHQAAVGLHKQISTLDAARTLAETIGSSGSAWMPPLPTQVDFRPDALLPSGSEEAPLDLWWSRGGRIGPSPSVPRSTFVTHGAQDLTDAARRVLAAWWSGLQGPQATGAFRSTAAELSLCTADPNYKPPAAPRRTPFQPPTGNKGGRLARMRARRAAAKSGPSATDAGGAAGAPTAATPATTSAALAGGKSAAPAPAGRAAKAAAKAAAPPTRPMVGSGPLTKPASNRGSRTATLPTPSFSELTDQDAATASWIWLLSVAVNDTALEFVDSLLTGLGTGIVNEIAGSTLELLLDSPPYPLAQSLARLLTGLARTEVGRAAIAAASCTEDLVTLVGSVRGTLVLPFVPVLVASANPTSSPQNWSLVTQTLSNLTVDEELSEGPNGLNMLGSFWLASAVAAPASVVLPPVSIATGMANASYNEGFASTQST